MSNPPLPPRLAFDYREGELVLFRIMAGYSLNRSLPWNSYWIVLGSMIFIVGFAVLGAQKSGLILSAQVPTVLLTAYFAFACGVGLVTLLRHRRQRRLMRASAAATGRSGLTREVEFTDSGMTWKNEKLETWVSWRAVKSVETWRSVILIWLVQFQTLAIPARIFANDAARKAFVAAVQACIDAAVQPQQKDIAAPP